MSKHAPRPWVASEFGDRFIVNDAEGYVVAYVGSELRTVEENAALAGMVAASPDMLKALEKAAEAIAGFCEQHPGSALAKSRARIDAAIAKAKSGESEELEWQPIETAPKDGSGILVAVPIVDGLPAQVGFGFFSTLQGDSEPRWHVHHGQTRMSYAEHRPTHWMPLPEPPQVIQNANKSV